MNLFYSMQLHSKLLFFMLLVSQIKLQQHLCRYRC